MRRSCLLLLLLAAPAAFAHPVPRDNYDRTIIVRLAPGRVVVDYRLEVSPIRAALDLGRKLADIKRSELVPAAFLKHMAPLLAEGLAVTLDKKELEFRCTSRTVSGSREHVRCDYRFEAPWKLEAGKKHGFHFHETNYPLDGYSLLHLTLDVSPALKATERQEPSDELLKRPPDKRRPGDARKLRQVSAVLLVKPESLPGVAKPALPFEDSIKPKLERTRRLTPCALKPSGYPHAIAKGGPGPEVEAPEQAEKPDTPEKPEMEEEDAPSIQDWTTLDLVVNTKLGLGVLLGLAAIFGAAHALTPGHGKTLVAAYLIGDRGTIWHATVLGLVTTLTHTAAVIVAALLLWLFFPQTRLEGPSVQASLHIVGGLIIGATGLWLLMQRLAGRADHVHFDEGEGAEQTGWWRLIMLGVGGGIVPCHDAVIILSLCVSAGQLWLALPLLLSFSAGLSVVLVAVGIAVVKARALLLSKRGPQGADTSEEVSLGKWDATLNRLSQALPVVSALVIIGIAAWMCYHGASLVR